MSQPLISLCVPSRGRPVILGAMIQSALEMAQHPQQIEILVYCDDDDYSMLNFIAKNTNMYIGKSTSISKMTNTLAANASGELIMYGADDVIFRTLNWDKIILDFYFESNLEYLLIHGDDLGQNSRKIATHAFVSRKLYNALGYLLPQQFSGDFCDTWLTDVTDKAKCRFYLPNLVIEHMHPTWGKADWDATYRSRSKLIYLLNLLKYNILTLQRNHTAQRLRASIRALNTSSFSD